MNVLCQRSASCSTKACAAQSSTFGTFNRANMRIKGGPGCPARVPIRPLRVPATDPAARIFQALFFSCSASLYSAITALTPFRLPSASAGTGVSSGLVVTATIIRSGLHASVAKLPVLSQSKNVSAIYTGEEVEGAGVWRRGARHSSCWLWW